MTFSETYKDLRQKFGSGQNQVVSSTGTRIEWANFVSCDYGSSENSMYLKELRSSMPGGEFDGNISENHHFKYPVFIPSQTTKNNGAILLLHGLNERTWDKYLGWADYLAGKTGKTVILFPISFHINRSSPEWLNRNIMKDRSEDRKKRFSLKDTESTLINEALSDRLTEAPQRLFLSGFQTADDIQRLVSGIYHGTNPFFHAGTHTDIFAYSIGGLLAQVLYIANPEELFSESKLFLFCAGSLFIDMNGVSKLIMDPVAHFRLHHYYRNELEEEIVRGGVFADFFHNNKLGIAFRSMIAPDRLRNLREKVFRSREQQIHAISFKKDRIIPAAAISEALLGSRSRTPSNMEIMDFSFPYTHEVPFPVKKEEFRNSINEAFELVFSRAALFLS